MEIQEPNEQQSEEHGVAIYSKWTVLLFSIFVSPLVGGILLMLNLRSVGYKRSGTKILFFAIGYQFLSSIPINYVASMMSIPPNDKAMFQNPQVIICVFILNLIGGGILAEYFFKKYFPHDDYVYKSIWKTLIIVLLIAIPLSILIRM
jgi:hypothetical protein